MSSHSCVGPGRSTGSPRLSACRTGGPQAVALAAGHPELVEGLILESAISNLPWPERATRVGAHLAFNPSTAPLTGRLTGMLARWAPGVFLRTMLRALSTGRGSRVRADLSLAHRVEVLDLLRSMRASRGFLHDIREPVDPGLEACVQCPTLIIASHHDGQVPPRHAEHLRRYIHRATLIWRRAPSHLIWFGSSAQERTEEVTRFLAEAPTRGCDPCRGGLRLRQPDATEYAYSVPEAAWSAVVRADPLTAYRQHGCWTMRAPAAVRGRLRPRARRSRRATSPDARSRQRLRYSMPASRRSRASSKRARSA
jgi:hypothetical protein